MNPSEVLIGTRDYLMEHGWTQHSGGVESDRRCALMAFEAAHGITGNGSVVSVAFDILEAQVVATGIGCVIEWNDTPGRTFNEIVDMFDRAIIKAKEIEA